MACMCIVCRAQGGGRPNQPVMREKEFSVRSDSCIPAKEENVSVVSHIKHDALNNIESTSLSPPRIVH